MAEIAMRTVRKAYGRSEIIHGIDLAIGHREFMVILGPSGCGKSTLLRMIAGLEEITAGEIAIDGTVVNRLEPRERGCAMVFQNYALYPHMSVAENIGYALKVAGVGRAERAARVAKVAETLGLTALLDRKPGALSGGQRQRVAMGRAMIREPKVFLFDEPLSNLDAKLRVQMRIEIKRLHRRLGTTSVFVTHDQIEAMTLADRLAVLDHGRLEQVGPPGEVYRRPASRFVAGFLGSPPMNFLEAELVDGRTLALPDGRQLRLEAGLAAAPADRRVTLGIRPEDIQPAAPGEPGSFPFSIEMTEELGLGRLLHGRLAGAEAIMLLPASLPMPVGTLPLGSLPVRLPAAALHLFEHESGRRIERAAGASTQLASRASS
jgi:sn-glycerol 3-phosphate transport system ATP-binding protein